MKPNRKVLLALGDILLLAASLWISLYIRYDGYMPTKDVDTLMKHMGVLIAIKIAVYIAMKMYRIYWRHASVREMIQILFATFLANLVAAGYFFVFMGNMPRAILPMVWLLDLFFVGGIRYWMRARVSMDGFRFIKSDDAERVLIIGAGDAGVLVCKELMKHAKSLQAEPIAFIDDDPQKQKELIHNVPVMGTRDDLHRLVEELEIDEIIFALPSASKEDRIEILNLANATGVPVKTVPGIYEMIDESFQISELRPVQIEDLLGRDQVELDTSQLTEFLQGKAVLITGGGGSIGSELARQIVRYEPSRLILLDSYENAVYDVQQELLRDNEGLNLTVHIDSVRDKHRVRHIMRKEKPQIVFHAAAHKHVPLMENSPASAIKNNIFGTFHMVEASIEAGVESFVMISTDKAVRPTNVMGTTKRFCEYIINAYKGTSDTKLVAVRFGNVLGSNGSVIPLFTGQIKRGGPVTVTDPNITRYFMTIPEATQLVLQAGAMAKGGEIYILDMGDPVYIDHLARELIRLSGFKPDIDIKIEYSGLRPGEKMKEELLIDEENSSKTTHEKIRIEKPEFYDMEMLHTQLALLMQVLEKDDNEAMVQLLQELVPTYQPNREGVDA